MPTPSVPSGLSALPPLETVDLVLLGVLLLFVLDGIRRGFIAGTLALAGLAATVLIALRMYPLAAGLIAQFVVLPGIVANVLGFLVVVLVVQILLGLLFRLLLGLRSLLGPLVVVDHVLGAIPGLAQGLLLAALILTPLYLFPVIPGVKEAIQDSHVAGPFVDRVAEAAPQIESLLGRAIQDSLVFRTPPASGESPTLNVPTSLNLRPDPDAEARMLELVNAERQRAGLSPLVSDERLQAVARAHGEEMFRLRYFGHESPVTGSPADRLRQAGLPVLVAGENLAYAPAVEVAHTGLMNSPGHRRNILSPDFGRAGIGVVNAGLYGKMFTQEFTD